MAAALRTSRQLDCKDLHAYMKTLPPAVLDNLYCHPATCLAIFRDLPILARHYVMRLLFVEQPVSKAVVGAWINSEGQSDHTEACKVLSNLRVWHEHSLPGGLPGVALNDVLRKHLKVALLGGGNPWTGAGALSKDKHGKDVSFLDSYAMERWECVLHFMVGAKEGANKVSRDVVDILLHSGLMKSDSTVDSEPYITPAGFQFLLIDTPSQVWYFMLQYLDTAENRGLGLVDCLTFLFQLSFSTLGKDYSTDGMTDNQSKFLQHLREFGLVYQRKRKSQRFYPTRLAVNLASGLKEGVNTQTQGFLVVDTNYRIYAYTESPLQIATLALFCEMLYRFANVVVANISRDSVREAVVRGITAQQIINYLKSNAHPEMMKLKPVLPSTITDQIRLWELERDRCKFTDGVLYNQFLSQSDFEMLRDYARDMDVLTWENPSRRMMVVSRGGHDEVKRFWKSHRQDS